MSTLTLRETNIVETDLDGIYVTDGESLFFMTAEQDNMPLNPRENDCNYCTICYVRNRYLGSSKYDNDRDFADSDDLNDYLAGLKDRGIECVSVPLYAYVHSGITISTGSFGDPWDSGCFGVAICTKEQVINAFSNDTDWKRHAQDIIEGEIKPTTSSSLARLMSIPSTSTVRKRKSGRWRISAAASTPMTRMKCSRLISAITIASSKKARLNNIYERRL